MANIKSSAKRDEKSKQLRAKNRADKTELKTMMKKFDAAVAEGNRETAVSAYKVAVKTVDRAAGKGLLHKNNRNGIIGSARGRFRVPFALPSNESPIQGSHLILLAFIALSLRGEKLRLVDARTRKARLMEFLTRQSCAKNE